MPHLSLFSEKRRALPTEKFTNTGLEKYKIQALLNIFEVINSVWLVNKQGTKEFHKTFSYLD